MMCTHLPDKFPCFSYGTPHRLFYVVFVLQVEAHSLPATQSASAAALPAHQLPFECAEQARS